MNINVEKIRDNGYYICEICRGEKKLLHISYLQGSSYVECYKNVNGTCDNERYPIFEALEYLIHHHFKGFFVGRAYFNEREIHNLSSNKIIMDEILDVIEKGD